MKVPRDQTLFFTIFFTICFGITLAVWIALPTTHKTGEEEEGAEGTAVKKVLSLEESIKRSEQIINRAEAALAEAEKQEKKTGAGKTKGKAPIKTAPKAPDKSPEKMPAKPQTQEPKTQ